MTRKLLLGAVAALALAAPASASAETVDIGLVIDGSGSIDSRDWALQREGFSTALRDPANVPLDGSVAISVVQFSNDAREEVPRTLIDSQEKLDEVVTRIEGMRQLGGGTNPQSGIVTGTSSLQPLREDSKTVLCLSSDGTGGSLNLSGAKAAGIERFSVIGIDDYGNTNLLRNYYGPHVYGGGAMTIARNTAEFATLIAGSCFGDAVTLRALEVNQGAQDWRNSKTLLELRETIVRAFVETPEGAPDERVTGRLIGRRNGVELPGSPLAATNHGGTVLARNDIESRRGAIADSLNFELPLSWLSGSIELEFEAGGAPVDCKEPADAGTPANDCRVAPPLAPTTTLGVAFYAIDIDGDRPSWADTAEQIARVQSALPVSLFNRSQRTLAYDSQPTIDDVNGDLQRIRAVERVSCAIFGCTIPVRDIYYGLIDGGALGGLNGKANGIPGDAASSVTNNLNNPTSTGYARNTVVHELSHSLGVHHAVDNSQGVSGGFLWWGGHKTGRCGEVASRNAPGHSPFVTVGGRIRPGLGPIAGADDEVWGLDHRFARANESGLGLSDPEQVWALMSYCNDGRGQRRWSSAFERDQQIAGLRALQTRAGGGGGGGGGSWETGEIATPAQVVAPPAGSRGVLISGTVDASAKTATVESALPLPFAGDAATGEGTFTLRVEGAGGTVLAQREFTPMVGFGEGEEDGLKASFAQAVAIPQDAEIERVVVVSDSDGPLGTRVAATGPAPTVSDVAISDASIETDPVTLSWKRTPGTTSTVLFSPDDGKSWRPLTFRRSGESFEIDPATLAGTAAGRFAVATTDGLRGAVAQLPDTVTVSVGNAAPSVEITSPRADDPSPSGVQPILFTAVAADRDQVLEDGAIVWRSDRDGVLGSGPTLTRTADTLAEGTHEITVTVTDDEGATATASVDIEVFRVAPPPPSADKTLTASGPSAAVTGGAVTTVVAKVSNAGPSSSRELRLTGTFPEGTTPRLPADLQDWTCSISGRELVCLRDGMLPAEATELRIPVAVADVGARTTRTVTFAVDAAVADPRPQDDRATVSFDVVPRPPAPTPTPTASPAPQPSAPPAGGAPPAAASTTPPARSLNLRIRQGRAQLLTHKFNVSVVARCGAVACSAEARGSVKIGSRTWRLKRARARIVERRSARLRLASSKSLRRAARAAIRRSPKRKLQVTVTVRVRGADGTTATRRVRVPVRSLR